MPLQRNQYICLLSLQPAMHFVVGVKVHSICFPRLTIQKRMLCPFLGLNTQKRSIKFSKLDSGNSGNTCGVLTSGHLKHSSTAQCSGSPPERTSFLYVVGFSVLYKKSSFHHGENWKRDDRPLWGHRVSSNHQSLVWGFTYFGNYHTPKPLQDYNLSAGIWNEAWNTNRRMIILIIYLVHIKSLVWGWKSSFRLRA